MGAYLRHIAGGEAQCLGPRVSFPLLLLSRALPCALAAWWLLHLQTNGQGLGQGVSCLAQMPTQTLLGRGVEGQQVNGAEASLVMRPPLEWFIVSVTVEYEGASRSLTGACGLPLLATGLVPPRLTMAVCRDTVCVGRKDRPLGFGDGGAGQWEGRLYTANQV